MQHIKGFSSFGDRTSIFGHTLNESKKQIEDVLRKHIIGACSIADSVKNLDVFNDYFDGYIPNQLKYQGVLYRIFQTSSKTLYNEILKKGFNALPSQKYYSCSKSMGGIESVIRKTSKNRYKYYIIFKFEVSEDDVLFDINKIREFLDIDENRFIDEEEVLVLSNKIPSLSKDNIIKHGIYTK